MKKLSILQLCCILLLVLQEHPFPVSSASKFRPLLSNARFLLTILQPESNVTPDSENNTHIPDLVVGSSIRQNFVTYILAPNISNNTSQPRFVIPGKKFSSSKCVVISRVEGSQPPARLVTVLEKILNLHKISPTLLTEGSLIVLHVISENLNDIEQSRNLPLPILRTPFKIILLQQTLNRKDDIRMTNYPQDRHHLQLGVRHSAGDSLFSLSEAGYSVDHYPCAYPMWVRHPDTFCSHVISLTQILGTLHNFTSRYSMNHESFRDGWIRHHKFITDENSVEMNSLHFMQASGYQVVFCDNQNTGNWEKSFYFQLKTWTHPLHPWVWLTLFFSVLMSIVIQIMLFNENLIQSLMTSIRIVVRQEKDGEKGRLLLTFSIAAFFLLLTYEAEFTCSILAPEATYIPSSLPELMHLNYTIAVPQDANPIKHRYTELRRVFPNTELSSLKSFFRVVRRLEHAEALLLNNTEKYAVMGVYIRGLGKSDPTARSGYIEKLQLQTKNRCHTFEEKFADTMLFWVIVNPIRYSLVRGIKWLEASGIPGILHKYYALWNEMRVKRMKREAWVEEKGQGVNGDKALYYVTIKHLAPIKAFFLLISGIALVIWFLELAGVIRCKKRKPGYGMEWGEIIF